MRNPVQPDVLREDVKPNEGDSLLGGSFVPFPLLGPVEVLEAPPEAPEGETNLLFPGDALPEGLREYMEFLEEDSHVPREMIAPVLLSALAGAAFPAWQIIETDHPWTPLNFYLFLVAESGMGKSSLIERVLKPFHPEGETNPLRRVTDATTEALAHLLQENEERLFFATAEGRKQIDIIGGLYRQPGRTDETLFLNAFSGDYTSVYRRGSKPLILKHPLLHVLLAVQPDKWENFRHHEALRDSGLFERILCVEIPYQARLIRIRSRETSVPELEFQKNVKRLLGLRGRKMALLPDETVLRAYESYHNELAQKMGNEGQYRDIRSYVSRWAEITLRLAGCLQAWSLVSREETWKSCFNGKEVFPLSQEAWERARAMMENFFLPYQLKSLEGVRAQLEERLVHKIRSLLLQREREKKVCTLREVYHPLNLSKERLLRICGRYKEAFRVEGRVISLTH
jgi:hypothetical protein